MALAGKRIVVLGGSSGIGLAVAQAAAGEGASLVIASSRQDKVDRAVAQIPGAEGHAVDLTEADAVATLFKTVGAFDHLVFTAGDALRIGSLADTELGAAKRFLDVRYWGALMAAKYGSAGLRAGGSIVFTGGTAGVRPRAGWALGASVCCAMEGLTRALAVELAPLRVNMVAPGLVKTPLWAALPDADREGMYKGAASTLPVGHVGEASEVAEAYLYLMRQTYGTGQMLVVDGGGSLV